MNADVDLLGNPCTPAEAMAKAPRRPQATGFAAPPGTGPEGWTCKSCTNYCSTGNNGRYKKCGLMLKFWTGGPGTDIKAGAAACRFFVHRPGAV